DDAPDNVVGGSSAAAGNVVSGNTFNGIEVSGVSNATGNVVQGNFIGTDVTGTVALGNGDDGVLLQNAGSNTVGGLTTTPGTAPGNLIAGNGGNAVHSLDQGLTADNNVVQGNLIGTDAGGTGRLGNAGDGVLIEAQLAEDSAAGNTIGGTAAGAGNVISGNLG